MSIIKRALSVFMAAAAASSFIFNAASAEAVKEIYVSATSHLDTVWSWDFEQTVSEYLAPTFTENMELMDKYPEYKFNFEGAYRYQLLEEYYPETFEKLKKYTSNGQWNVSGSALENGDVNIPSPEAIFRNILYGNNYFEDNFGQRSKDIYLPDCFGFGYALPSITAHSNLHGFSTQKLSWTAALPGGKLPFDTGLWKGPDGNAIVANINLNNYIDPFDSGFRYESRINEKLNRSPVGKAAALYGSSGDRGGSVPQHTVQKLIEEQKANASSSRKVIIARTDDMINKLYEDPTGLETYDGELLLKEHGTGSYTSQALSKRWNRQAEQMAYSAEMTNVNSMYLGATEYPAKEFEKYWTKVIAHQFHDDITGTSNAETYLRSRNDYMTALKQFANEYKNGAENVIKAMNTTVPSGEAIIINNTLAFDREGIVSGTVKFDAPTDSIAVYDDNGEEVPSQILEINGNDVKVAFVANVKSMGYRKYNVVPGESAYDSPLSVTENSLENEKYKVTINDGGDIASIYDKQLGKELLKSPVRYALFDESDYSWAAWEIKPGDYNKAPTEYVDSKPEIEITENGPARVALKITRKYGKSTYTQTVSLSSGGKMVEVANNIDWHETAKLLKAEFNLTSANPEATYDLGLGTITRGNNTNDKAEVPHQKWADLTKSDGSYGVSIINDCKYGIDKLNDSTMRLTLIHTPKQNFTHSPSYGSSGQNQQDMGENNFSFAIYGHEGEYSDSEVQKLAEAFNQPMYGFQSEQHEGALGTHYSFGSLNNDNIILRAIKKAEKSDEIIVRVNEGSGKTQNDVRLSLGSGILSAREVYASEEEFGPAEVNNGELVFDIGRYGVKTFALTLAPSGAVAEADKMLQLELDWNIDAYSGNDDKLDGSFNIKSETFPSELVPDTIFAGGIKYKTGSKADGEMNALSCSGQTITIPDGYTTLYLLAFSANGDKTAAFNAGGKQTDIVIGDYSENIGAGDSASLGMTGYVKDQTPGFAATHRHTAGEDNIGATTYMFEYSVDVENAESITLPDDDDIVIFAATLSNEQAQSVCITDTNDKRERTGDVFSDAEKGITFDGLDKNIITNYTTNSRNISDSTCDFSADKSASGDTSLKITGTASNDSYVYYTISNQEISIRDDTVLTYSFFAENENGRNVAVDMEFNSGLPLRDREGAVDQNNVSIHPGTKKGVVGEWVTVTCDLGAVAGGQKMTKLMVAYDNPSNTGNFTAYVDDIKIYSPTNNLETMLDETADLAQGSYGKKSYDEFKRAYEIAKTIADDENAAESEKEYALNILSDAYYSLTVVKDGTLPINACDFDSYTGVLVRENNNTNIGGVNNASSATYNAIDFGKEGVDTITLNYSGADTGQNPRVAVIDGSHSGDVLAIVDVPQTGSWGRYKNTTVRLNKTLTGEHDITLIFRSYAPDTLNLKTMSFTKYVSVESVNVEPESVELTKGQTALLKAGVTPDNATYKDVTWTSDNPLVAAVSSGGLITTHNAGTALITATADGVTDVCKVTVNDIIIDNNDNPPKPDGSQNINNGTAVQNGVKDGILYQNGAAVTGTKAVTVSGKIYAVINGRVAEGSKTRAVNIGTKKYIVNKYGVVQKSNKGNKVITAGTKKYIVNKNGVVQRPKKGNKLVTAGKNRYIVSKSGAVQKPKKGNKLVAVGTKKYVVNKKGIVQFSKKSAKAVKVGKKTYILAKKTGAVIKNKRLYKIGKVKYKISKTGSAKKVK